MDSKAHIRWMVRRDMDEVLEIEKASFEFPWSDEDFARCLRQRNCIGMIAELRGSIVGYFIYELNKTQLHVLNFAVHPDWRRKGIGLLMAEKLVGKLSQQRRTRITLEIRETNMPGLMFFKAAGFVAVSIVRDFYDDTTDDAYVMQYRHSKPDETPGAHYLNRGAVMGLFRDEV